MQRRHNRAKNSLISKMNKLVSSLHKVKLFSSKKGENISIFVYNFHGITAKQLIENSQPMKGGVGARLI